MEIRNQLENLSVHNHEVNERLTFITELSFEVDIENLGESCKDNINLLVTKNL